MGVILLHYKMLPFSFGSTGLLIYKLSNGDVGRSGCIQ